MDGEDSRLADEAASANGPSAMAANCPVSSVYSAWYDWAPGEGPKGNSSGRALRKTRKKTVLPEKRASSERPESKTSLQGKWGERKAEEWLVRNAGLKALGRRVKVGRDELDLVMKAPASAGKPGEIVFVEVKTRGDRLFGGGLGAIDRRKRHALGRAASRWMMKHADCPMRIDVVEVYGDFETDRVDEIRHWEAAIPLEKRINALLLGCGR